MNKLIKNIIYWNTDLCCVLYANIEWPTRLRSPIPLVCQAEWTFPNHQEHFTAKTFFTIFYNGAESKCWPDTSILAITLTTSPASHLFQDGHTDSILCTFGGYCGHLRNALLGPLPWDTRRKPSPDRHPTHYYTVNFRCFCWIFGQYLYKHHYHWNLYSLELSLEQEGMHNLCKWTQTAYMNTSISQSRIFKSSMYLREVKKILSVLSWWVENCVI